MTVGEVRDIIEQWAPREVAWEQDNTGLQVGDPDASVRAVLVALDITEAVVAEARKKRANLIVSHHPLLFRPLRAVTMKEARGRIIRALAKWDINAYAAHTNMDFSRGGTSFALGQALGLERIEFLQTPYRVEKKIVTFVPA